jgi:multidrug resistance efflux pump
MSSNSIDMGTHYTVTADAESMALYNAMQEAAAKYDAAIKAFAPARDALLAMQKAGIRKGLKAAKLAYDEGWYNLNDTRVDMEEAQRVWVADFHAKYRTVTVTE